MCSVHILHISESEHSVGLFLQCMSQIFNIQMAKHQSKEWNILSEAVLKILQVLLKQLSGKLTDLLCSNFKPFNLFLIKFSSFWF